jgi:hypothetical protein
MMNGKYIKLDRVIENVGRDYGFTELNWINCVEWVGECLDLIGAPMTYIQKATDGNESLGHQLPITIEDNRGKIPCDLHKLIQGFRKEGGSYIPMRVSTDTTHISYLCNDTVSNSANLENTYKLNNGYIFTSFDAGEVMLVYMANPTDERGYPMIPDNIKYIKACQAYIGDKMIFKKEIQGHPVSGRVVQKIEQELAWYTAAADSSARIPTIDEMESWKNNFIKLIPNINSHASAFRSDGQMEKRFNNSTNDRNSRTR